MCIPVVLLLCEFCNSTVTWIQAAHNLAEMQVDAELNSDI
jgi:hypothetical protein